MRADGTYVGRSAPEIDVFEASVSSEVGGQVRVHGARFCQRPAKFEL